jgi:gamma-glutamyltranspeptidase/glutathione hydrolase
MDLKRTSLPPAPAPPQGDGETNHLSVVDAQGNAVALTQSIGNNFGSKVVNPDLGFFYAYSYDMNDEPVPLQREWTSQSPTIITRDGDLFLVAGSAGSNRIPGSIVRTAVNLIDHGMELEGALAARRWYIVNDELRIEGEGLPDPVQRALEEMGYRLNLYPSPDGYFARVHAIHLDTETGLLTGGSDPRDFGGAKGR